MKDFVINEKSEKLIQHYKQGDWRKILDLFANVEDGYYDERYLWIRPSEENLRFISDEVGTSQLISVGCGCGLLEWLIQEATGVRVIGLEVDRNWWESSYSTQTFIPLRYADEFKHITTSKEPAETALLFCYFNNAPAFDDYIKNYDGDCVVIIGPGDGRETHTDPEPFTAKLPGWKLTAQQEIRTTKDFIVVYRR